MIERFGAGEPAAGYRVRIDRDASLDRDDRPDVEIAGWDACAAMFQPSEPRPA